MQEQIDSIPNLKEEPDQETLDFWNEMNVMGGDKEVLEIQLKEKQDLLNKLKAL